MSVDQNWHYFSHFLEYMWCTSKCGFKQNHRLSSREYVHVSVCSVLTELCWTAWLELQVMNIEAAVARWGHMNLHQQLSCLSELV